MKRHLLFIFVCLAAVPQIGLAHSGAGHAHSSNPTIGLNLLFLGQAGVDAAKSRWGVDSDGHLSSEKGTPYGADIQEAELMISSAVDAHWELSGHIVFHGGEFHLEEAYAINRGIPALSLKLGKMKASFGQHALLHTHAFPFVQAPLVVAGVLGEEGYIDTGLEATWFSPLPLLSKFTLGAYSGSAGHDHAHSDSHDEAHAHGHGGPLAYDSPRKDDFAYLGRWGGSIETGEDSRLETGFSGLTGRNAHGIMEGAWGLDVSFKSLPSDASRGAWIVQGEWISRLARHNGENEKGIEGLYLFVQHRVSPHWWLGARWDRVLRTTADVTEIEPLDEDEDGFQDTDTDGHPLWEEHHHPTHPADSAKRWTANLTWTPGDATAVRLEYSFAETRLPHSETLDRRVFLQFNQTIGSHAGHDH
jgi:hypothetical protein